MLMHRLLMQGAERAPDKAAFTWVDRGVTSTYEQSVDAMEHMAGALTSLGVCKGDRVTVFAHNGMDYLYAMLGAWRIGAVAALVNVKFEHDLAYYFADHSPKVVIYTHDMEAVVRAAASMVQSIQHLVCMDGRQSESLSLPDLMSAKLRPAPDPEDENAIAHLSYTSGTTGRPKGACLAHEPTVRAARCIAERLRIRSNDVSFGPTALSSSYQLVANLLPPLAQGASIFVMRFWTQPAGWDALDKARASIVVGNPTVLQEIHRESVARGRSPEGLRMGLSGGAPVPVSLKKAWRDGLKLPLVESFGQSELGGFMALGFPELEPDENKLVRVGPPLPDKDLWISGPDGERLGPGATGAIVLRGGCMWGYWGNPVATAKAIRGADGAELHTGDLGFVDRDGFVTMRGRHSELLAVNQVTWYARDVEEALCSQPGVRQAALVGFADQELGSRPHAFITVDQTPGTNTIDLVQLKAAIRRELVYDLDPLEISVMEAFPMTPTGKIAKSEITLPLRATDRR